MIANTINKTERMILILIFTILQLSYMRLFWGDWLQTLLVCVGFRILHRVVKGLIETINCPAQMRNGYRAAHHQRDVESVKKLRAAYSSGDALFDVICNA